MMWLMQLTHIRNQNYSYKFQIQEIPAENVPIWTNISQGN